MSSNNAYSSPNNPIEIEGSHIMPEYHSHVNGPRDVDIVWGDILNSNFGEDLETLLPEPLCYVNNLHKRVVSLEHDYREAKQSRNFWLNEYHDLGHHTDDMAQLIN